MKSVTKLLSTVYNVSLKPADRWEVAVLQVMPVSRRDSKENLGNDKPEGVNKRVEKPGQGGMFGFPKHFWQGPAVQALRNSAGK